MLLFGIVMAVIGGRAEMMNARVRFESTEGVRLSDRSACLATEIRQDSGDWLVIEPGEFSVFQPSNGKSDVYAASETVSRQTVTWMKELGWTFELCEAGTYDVWMRARFPLAANYNHVERMDEGPLSTLSDSLDGARVDKSAGVTMFSVQDTWLEPGHWHWFKNLSYDLSSGRHFFHWPANAAWNGGCELDRIVLVRRGSSVAAESAGLANRTVVRARSGELVSHRIRLEGVKAWAFEVSLRPGDGRATVEYAYRPGDWRSLDDSPSHLVPPGEEYLYLRIRLQAANAGIQPRVDNFRFRVERKDGSEKSASGCPVPSAAQLDYFRTGMMGIIHYGLNTYIDREWGFGDTSPAVFSPKALDPEQWVRAATRGGLKRLILVAKHHDGFCLFPSRLNTDYTVANTGWKGGKGDLVREFGEACRRQNIEFGVYLSPWDRHRADYATAEYADYYLGQWKEILAHYGPIAEIWLDGANGGDGWYGGAKEIRKLPQVAGDYYRFGDLLKLLAEHDPRAVAFGGGCGRNCVQWVGNEAGMNAETYWYDESGEFLPFEADTPFRKGGWFWHPNDKAKSLSELVNVYFLTVGRGAVLNLGLAPNRDGLLDEGDVTRLSEFGEWVRKFESVDFAAGARRSDTLSGLTRSVTLTLKDEPVLFNAIDFGEDLRQGQQIAGWSLEALERGVWREIASGTTVGFRRMERFEETSSRSLRLTCRGRFRTPELTTLALRFAERVADEERGEAFEQWRSPCKVTEVEPGELEFDFLRRVSADAIQYVPAANRVSGVPDRYEIAVSDDGRTWTGIADGEFGNLRANPVAQRHSLPRTVTMRYARVKATRALEGRPTWRGALFEFFTQRK